MTTFTSDDREEEYKKIVAAAPFQPGYEDAVPMASPPHIVDSGASVMVKDLTDEEIWEVINRTAWVGTEEEIRFKIAEAILRKAQEK
jgi:hypothetical protein